MTTRLTSVTTEPVTLAEAKLDARIDGTEYDSMIPSWIAAARSMAEQACGRAFALATYTLKLDAFPAGEIRLDWSPVASITSVQYIDTAGATQTLASSAYVLDSHNLPAWLLPAYGTEWPDTLDAANAVTVTYVAGEGTSTPDTVKTYIKAHIAERVKNAEATSDKPLTPLPYLERLLDRERVY